MIDEGERVFVTACLLAKFEACAIKSHHLFLYLASRASLRPRPAIVGGKAANWRAARENASVRVHDGPLAALSPPLFMLVCVCVEQKAHTYRWVQ